jgi:biopolymer transport protein TolR
MATMSPADAAEPEDELLSAGAAPLSEINITPFVDVMLVLLIVFMVAAPLMMAGVNVSLPRTAAASVQPRRDPVVLSLDRDGQAWLGQEAVAAPELPARLRALAAAEPDQVIHVRADQTLPYRAVMEAMGAVASAGFGRVSLLAEQARPPR